MGPMRQSYYLVKQQNAKHELRREREREREEKWKQISQNSPASQQDNSATTTHPNQAVQKFIRRFFTYYSTI